MADKLGDSGKHLAVVEFQDHPDAETAEHLIDHLEQFNLIDERVRADHIGVTLVELAVAAFLRTVGAPYGLDLIPFERHLEVVAVLHHIAGERHRQVVAQSLLTDFGGQLGIVDIGYLSRVDILHVFPRVENLEEELVTLLAIFPHQRGEVFQGGSLHGVIAIEAEDGADGVENIVASSHFHRGKVARSFGYGGFHL